MVLQYNIDESEDETCFVLAAYGATPEQWRSFSSRWKQGLDGFLGGEPFKMAVVNQRDEASQRQQVGYFYDIIQENVTCSFSIIVDPRILKRVFGGYQDEKFTIPYFFCFYHLMMHILLSAESEQVQFVFDDGRQSKLIRDEWAEFISAAPPEQQKRLLGEPTFLSDTHHLPLQAADMKAWWVRKRFKEKIQGDAVKPEMRNFRENLPKIPTHTIWYSEEELKAMRLALEHQVVPVVGGDRIGFQHVGGGFAGIGFRPQ